MISKKIVREVDQILDGKVSETYKGQPLAQDWARVAKLAEEIAEMTEETDSTLTAHDHERLSELTVRAGKAIQELISATGQNPRKPTDPGARKRMLAELADAAMTAVYAIQHFTKDENVTEAILLDAQIKHHTRLVNVNTPGEIA